MHLTDVDQRRDGVLRHHRRSPPDRDGRSLSAHNRGTDQVAVCFFGDGKTNYRRVPRSALHGLDLENSRSCFVCENNLYMEYTPIAAGTPVKNPAAESRLRLRAGQILIDGNDADVVYRTAQSAIARARDGAGQSLIRSAEPYRHHGHSRKPNPAKIIGPKRRRKVEAWMKRDPIPLYRQRLIEYGVAESTSWRSKENQASSRSSNRSGQASRPPADELIYKDVWADGGLGMAELTYRDAGSPRVCAGNGTRQLSSYAWERISRARAAYSRATRPACSKNSGRFGCAIPRSPRAGNLGRPPWERP